MSTIACRIIARLDIKGPNVVKGIHLEGLRALGNPSDFAKYYYLSGIDELLYIDVVASLYERNSLIPVIEKTASEIFVPLTVGGGIRSIEDITSVLRAGADKVAINTAAIKNPGFISQASAIFGSSTIVITIEAHKEHGKYYAYTDNGREYTGIEVISWAKKAENLGAGEILLTSIDNEGTGVGFDTSLTAAVCQAVKIPVIASGGAGRKEHVKEIFSKGNADAAAMASLFHYEFCASHHMTVDHVEGNRSFLDSMKQSNNIKPIKVQHLKKYLARQHIPIRK